MTVVQWPNDVLSQADIPAQSKAFLASKGLPEFVSVPWLEFGIYDSEPSFVIGQASDGLVVVVRSDGLVEFENADGQSLYMNRNVETLAIFIELFASEIPVADLRERMMHLDPESMKATDGCFWPQVLDYEECIDATT